MHLTRTRWIAAVAVALAVALGARAAGDGDDDPPRPAGASTTTTLGAEGGGDVTATTVPGAEGWDGVRYDLGILDRIDRLEDGRTIAVFDRVQLVTDGGTRQAGDFTEEPIVHGNTDHPFVNENTRLRRYVVDPAVEVLVLGNRRDVCADGGEAPEPRWDAVTVDVVVDRSLWDEYQQVSLTFGDDGRVTRIRLSTGC